MLKSKIAVLLAAATILPVACNKGEVEENAVPDGPQVVNIYANPVDDGSQTGTKALFSNESSSRWYWQESDEIGVATENTDTLTPLKFQLMEGVYALFSGKIYNKIGRYAIYPYSPEHKINGTVLTFHLPSEYTYKEYNSDYYYADGMPVSANPPLYAKLAENPTLDNMFTQFKHLGAMICVKIIVPGREGTVTLTADRRICGDFETNLNYSSPIIMTDIEKPETPTDNVVTIHYSDAVPGSTMVCYYPVPEGLYNLTVTSKGWKIGEDGDTEMGFTKSGSKEYPMEAGSIQRIDLTGVQHETTGRYRINGHIFLDLGLESGVLWAETNLGASAPVEDGDFFCWGETKPKEDYSWGTYKYGNGETTITKVKCTKYNPEDGKTLLEPYDDAATANWGSPCRIPTIEEARALLGVYHERDAEIAASGDKVGGFRFSCAATGQNIFIPLSGPRYQHTKQMRIKGYYWTTALSSASADSLGRKAQILYVYQLVNEFAVNCQDVWRIYGATIRPVADKPKE